MSKNPSKSNEIDAANHKLRKKKLFWPEFFKHSECFQKFRIFQKIDKLCSTFIRETRVLTEWHKGAETFQKPSLFHPNIHLQLMILLPKARGGRNAQQVLSDPSTST